MKHLQGGPKVLYIWVTLYKGRPCKLFFPFFHYLILELLEYKRFHLMRSEFGSLAQGSSQ